MFSSEGHRDTDFVVTWKGVSIDVVFHVKLTTVITGVCFDKVRQRIRRKPELKSEIGYAPVDVLGIRMSELKHVTGLTKLNHLGREHESVGYVCLCVCVPGVCVVELVYLQ